MEEYIWEIITGVAVVFNLIATLLVIRSDAFEKAQKIAQVVLIWIIPFIASIGISIFIWNDRDSKLPPSSPGGGASDRISQL